MQKVLFIILLMASGCSEKQVYESSSKVPTATLSAPLPTTNYDKFVGVYKMQGAIFDMVTITQENGQLFAQATGEPKVEIFPEEGSTFSVPAFNAKVTFLPGPNSIADSLSVLLEGNVLKGRKQ